MLSMPREREQHGQVAYSRGSLGWLLDVRRPLKAHFQYATASNHKFHELKSQARVSMRSFHLPQVKGKMVRFCLSHLNQCGKPAADAFCRINGFKEAFTFQRNGSDETTVTNFRQINCRHSAKTVDADQVHDFSGDRIMLAENHPLSEIDISNIVEHAPVVSRMAGARPPKGAFVG